MALTYASGPVALVANTPQTVTVHAGSYGVWVVNTDTTGAVVWARLDGTAAAAAAGSFVVLGARNFPVPAGPVAVSLFSTGTPTVTVEGAVPTGPAA